MPVQMPFVPAADSGPFYRVGVVLGDRQYIFDVRWNARDGAWYFDMFAEDESPIVVGVKIVLGALLGGRCVSADFPDGVFIASDLENTGRDATIDDLGTRVAVYFYTTDELEA